jgi:amino acid transporter
MPVNVNVYWHVFGVTAVVLILVFIPTKHQTLEWMFTTTNNNSGFSTGMYWWYVLPLGFLLTQYTITGFDASAHVSEETSGASNAAAKGIWQSILFSAIGGWLLLLAFLYAATDVDAINKAGGFSPAIFLSSLPLGWVKVLLVITCVGQFLCGMSCITAGSRMLFAFSRDKAVPGHKYWTKLDKNRNPSNAAFGIGILAAILTLPALWAPEGTVVPVAFFAVTSVTVIGLFLSFLIPIYLRWRMGDKFKQGSWNLGNKWKWMAPIAIVEIVFITIVLCLPTTPAGVPGNEAFTWKAVQYAPLAILFVIGAAMLWWQLSAKKWFTGPKIVN